VKAQRAVNNPDGDFDPVSGYDLDEIIDFIKNYPIGEEAISIGALRKIKRWISDQSRA